MLNFVKWVDSPSLKCCYDAPCEGWEYVHQTDEYQSKAVHDVGALQVLTHVNGEFVETIDGSVEPFNHNTSDYETVANYPAFVKALKEIGYDGYLSYEFCHMPFLQGKILGYNDYIKNQLRLARIYLENLINS